MNRHQNKSPREFRQMLEQRLKREAQARGWSDERARKRLAFERFMVRAQEEFGSRVTLKGGVAMELRVARARATLDVDLHMYGAPEEVRERLERAGKINLEDRLSFVVSVPRHDEIRNDALEYGGARFSVLCKLDDKEFERFTLDVSFAEEMFDEVEEGVGLDVLSYLDVEAPRLRIYPLTTHVAEKLHAYTLPDVAPTRLKDLPDMALLAQQADGLDAARLLEVIQKKFALRERNARVNRGDDAYAHPVPGGLKAPPEAWEVEYAQVALNDGLPWETLGACYEAARAFLEPVLAGEQGRWSAARWAWVPEVLSAEERRRIVMDAAEEMMAIHAETFRKLAL